LFAKPLLSNGCSIFVYLAVVAQQRAYVPQYIKMYPMQINIYGSSHGPVTALMYTIKNLRGSDTIPDRNICTKTLYPIRHTVYVHTDIFPSVAYLYTEAFSTDLRLYRNASLMGTHTFPQMTWAYEYISSEALFPVRGRNSSLYNTRGSHLPAHAVYCYCILKQSMWPSVLFLSHLTVPSSLMKCLMEAVKVHSQGWNKLCIPHGPLY
jgi:hypothetical protein